MEIALLGPPTFRIGDVPYVFKAPPLCLPLLAYLLVHRRSTLQRAAVAYLFWPDDDEDEARGKLRRHLHRLQSALPGAEEPWL
ncbi:MAG: hypothetical protein M3154_09140, partial [Candidatus Eremiobacteraeota bacterium]|nr:hypothetical protein [Candidatus Eremiobacteraeota bacterium]